MNLWRGSFKLHLISRTFWGSEISPINHACGWNEPAAGAGWVFPQFALELGKASVHHSCLTKLDLI